MKISSQSAILAAMAGITDISFVEQFYKTGFVGKVTIGGYPIGGEMIKAAINVSHRNRKEFILPSKREAEKISQEFESFPPGKHTILNLRINRVDDCQRFAQEFSRLISAKPIIEINAHCRQPEFLESGAGQNLLRRSEILNKIIQTFQAFDFQISIKIRGNTIEPNIFSNMVNNQEIDFVHVDSYQNNVIGTDIDLLKQFIEQCNSSIIGNNSVIDRISAEAILQAGADYFSLARAVMKNKQVFHKIITY